MTDIPRPVAPGPPLFHHQAQYNLTEDEMHVIAFCNCGWRTQPEAISDEPTTWAERSAAVGVASATLAEKVIAHLEGYPCPGCGGSGKLPSKKWEPDVLCRMCLGSGTCWPDKDNAAKMLKRRKR